MTATAIAPAPPGSFQPLTPEAMREIWKTLDIATREYINLYWAKKRKHDKLATAASNKWTNRKGYVTAYCKHHGYSEFQTREKVRIDWVLNDAMDAWSWHTREAARCSEVITAELSARILLGIGLVA